ncbi:leucine-rich repeat-containing protein 56 [Culicoides brevitarsis]|uniref:leucine-rich repeat-containing protein 56 n=1 Tax=Culicoides brevitarsis TaxID=469753 RepID=UPI00307BFA9E
MPFEEIPNDEQNQHEPHSDGSSISSGSISRVYSFSSQNNGNSDSEHARHEHIIIENQLNMENLQRGIERNRDLVEYQGPVTYSPIVIPAEPSLDELLRQVSGTEALNTVTEIKLRVISHMISLQRIPMFCPNIKILNLEGSVVGSLRDLGTDMRTLLHLNVSRCGLRTLDGTNGLVKLEELVADNNEIEDANPVTNLPSIKKLSLKGNKITKVASVSFLALCHTLTMLDLNDNLITETKDYRKAVKRSIPQLVVLDGIPLEGAVPNVVAAGNSLSSSDYKSSSSEEQPKFEWKPEDDRGVDWIRNDRPGTAFVGRQITRTTNERPSTAEQTKQRSLVSGEPLVGNILQQVRRNRKKKQAWADSSSSISSTEISEGSARTDFPSRLEQNPVDLELGLVGSEEAMDLSDENILEAARVWRRQSAQRRERIRTADKARNLDQLFRDD